MPLDPLALAEVRKTVTAVFCDVTGSTALGERLDPETLRTVMEAYFASVSAVLTRHGGLVEKFIGDAVMAVFGVPSAHEDDALRACRAGLEMQGAVAEVDAWVTTAFGVRFEVRVGIETGEVLVGDPARGSTFASGAPVNMAARLEQAAGPGEVLLGEHTLRLVRDVVVVEPRPGLTLKGLAAPVGAFRLVDVVSGPASERPARAPLVGRERELALLAQALDRSTTHRTCHLATLLGVAGSGKSRLAAEFIGRCPESVRVLRGRCVSYGEGVTYRPLVEVVRQAAGLTGVEQEAEVHERLAPLVAGDPDAERLVGRLVAVAGVGGEPGSVEDSAWAVRRLLECLAAEQPVVLILDDVHWAEQGLVEIVESICDWSRDAPILIVVLARPELLDTFPTWGAGKVNSVSALLEPLGDMEVNRLAGELLGGDLPADVVERVRAAAGGNPLFVEQLLAMLVEDGRLRQDGDRWVAAGDLTRLQMPPTIAALLSARLDLLTAAERAVLGPASVMGQLFYRAALSELVNLPQDEIQVHLKALLRKGLLRPASSDLPGQDALLFAHVLVRDAAYATLPKSARAKLHERFARWLDAHSQGSAYDCFVGEQLEQAYHNRFDLGVLDAATELLGRQASERLAAEGRSLMYVDNAAAATLLDRADRLRHDDGPERWRLKLDIAEMRQGLGYGRAVELVSEVLAAAQAAQDVEWALRARLQRASIDGQLGVEGATDQLRHEAEQALTLFESLGDQDGLSRARQAMSEVFLTRYQSDKQIEQIQLAADHADLAGEHGRAEALRRWTVLPLVWGSCPASQGLLLSHSLLEAAVGRAAVLSAACASAYFAMATGKAMEAAAAKDLADRTSHGLVGFDFRGFILGHAELTAGDLTEALSRLSEGGRKLRAEGEVGVLSSVAALYAHALLRADNAEDARTQVATALRTGTSDDVMTQGLAAAAQAWLAALDGDPASVEHYADAALAHLAGSDGLDVFGIVHSACSEAWTVVGDLSAALRHREAAVESFVAKGNIVAAERQRALLQAIAS